jgi:hypothetical protein
VRQGPWKAHFATQPGYGGGGPVNHDPPALYHLERDPGESYDVAQGNPQVIEQIKRLADQHQATVEPVPNQLEAPLP